MKLDMDNVEIINTFNLLIEKSQELKNTSEKIIEVRLKVSQETTNFQTHFFKLVYKITDISTDIVTNIYTHCNIILLKSSPKYIGDTQFRNLYISLTDILSKYDNKIKNMINTYNDYIAEFNTINTKDIKKKNDVEFITIYGSFIKEYSTFLTYCIKIRYLLEPYMDKWGPPEWKSRLY